jgi:hypothetical protein
MEDDRGGERDPYLPVDQERVQQEEARQGVNRDVQQPPELVFITDLEY